MKVSEFLRMMPHAWSKGQRVKVHFVFEDQPDRHDSTLDSLTTSTMEGDAPWIINNIPADYDMPVQEFHTQVEYINEKPVSVLIIGAWL